MLFSISQNSTFSPLPYAPFSVGGIQYPANVLDIWTPAELATIGVYPLVASVTPHGQIVIGKHYELRDGVVHELAEFAPAPPTPAPQQVAMHRVKKAAALTVWGTSDLLTAIYAAIDDLPAPSNRLAKIEFDSAPNLVRDGLTTQAVCGILGMTSEQLDDLLRFAETLP